MGSGSYKQKKSVVYSIDRKTGKEKKEFEDTGEIEEYKQEEISADEFNEISTASKAAAAAAKAKAALKKNGGKPTSGRGIVNKGESPMAGRAIVNKGMS